MQPRFQVLSLAALLLVAPQSIAATFFEIQKAAEAGDAAAQLELGKIYLHGQHTGERHVDSSQDGKLAQKWIGLSAQQNNAEAYYYLCIMEFTHFPDVNLGHDAWQKEYQDGFKRSDQLCEKAAVLGNANAQARLGWMAYFSSEPEKQAQAPKWIQMAAAQGHAQAQTRLATMYERGKVFTQNFDEALKLYIAASKQNYAPALMLLGDMYVQGHGVKQDYREAASLYRKAAELKDRQALYKIAELYLKGLGVSQSDSEALRLYMLADAQFGQDAGKFDMDMGGLFISDVAIDYGSMLKLLEKDANAGNATTQFLIGNLYEEIMFHPNFLKKDKAIAASWYRKAAEQGHAKAQLALGRIAKTYEEAYFWLTLAKNQGEDVHYGLYIDDAEKHLSVEQRAQIAKKAAEWKPSPTSGTTPSSKP